MKKMSLNPGFPCLAGNVAQNFSDPVDSIIVNILSLINPDCILSLSFRCPLTNRAYLDVTPPSRKMPLRSASSPYSPAKMPYSPSKSLYSPYSLSSPSKSLYSPSKASYYRCYLSPKFINEWNFFCFPTF